jgi:hypothetical protein
VQRWKIRLKNLAQNFSRMGVAVELHNTGTPEVRRELIALIEHVLSGRTGAWRVSIIGSQDSERWEMKIFGPYGFERTYTLESTAEEHDPLLIAAIISRMVPKS